MPSQRTPLKVRPLGLVAAALLYMMVAGTASVPPPRPAVLALLDPASGLALTLLLLGGPRLAWGVLAGALATSVLNGAPPVAALAEALAGTLPALLGAWLMRWSADVDEPHISFATCRQLLLCGCGVAAGACALAASTGQLLAGQIGAADWPLALLRGWMGPALGMALVTPLLLSWWQLVAAQRPLPRRAEGLLLYALAGAAGQAIFSGWHSDAWAPLANAYWMFLFVAWSGVRLGMFATAGLLCLIALQTLWGASQRTGFFARDLDASEGFGCGSYLMILALVGLSLAAYMTERRRQKAALRVAAIAFEGQQGMLVTNPRGVILQANQAFLRMSGHAMDEVLGRTPQFLRAPDAALPEGATQAGADFTPATAQQRSEWHQRKSGEVYPVWLTLSPVQSPHGRITHHVLTLTDITDRRQQQAQRRQMEQAHREALVQEVHHRIKNNLQGVMGMLRALDHKHPRLHGPINQVIGQVHSIAVIHGLQGSTTADRVRLGELIGAVAGGIESLWHTPIHVDTPAGWSACHVTPAEAVPVALVLNELILNAVKHGGKSQQDVRVRLHAGPQADSARITIANPGRWPPSTAESTGGLGLVAALLPRHGAQLTRSQSGDWAVLHLDLAPPVIHIEPHEAPHHV